MRMPAPPAAIAAAAAAFLVAASPPGTILSVATAVTAALALGAIVVAWGGPGSTRRWPEWVACVALAAAACRIAGGTTSAAVALSLGACAAAAVVLRPAAACAVVAVALGLEATATAWARWTPWALGADGSVGRLLVFSASAACVAAAAGFLSARVRAERERLVSQLGALTAVSATPTRDGTEALGGGPRSVPPAGEGSAFGELSSLLELTRRALRARSCVLFERSVDPPSWVIASGASVAADFDALARAPLGHGLVAWAAKHEVPMRLSDGGPQLRTVPYYSTSTTGSFVAVPLAAGERSGAPGEEGAWAVLACDSPLTRAFDEESGELLRLHAAEIASRLSVARDVARARHDVDAFSGLSRAAGEVAGASGTPSVALRLLEEGLALTGAGAGALVLADVAGEFERGRGPLLAAAVGLALESGHRLEPEEESWATWCMRRPDAPVRLAAFGPDRGMPRVARGDGLDGGWSFAAWALEDPDGSPVGSLSLAWRERRLPGAAVLESAQVLARVGAATLLREAARERLSLGKGHDALTGLPSRAAFVARGRALAGGVKLQGGRLSVACFDLDRSRRLQETEGIEAWEAAMEALARVLQAALPATAELYRWGGDEIVALLPGAGEEGALVAAKRAASAVAGGLGGRATTVGAGVATLVPERESFDGQLERAMAALSVARQVGGGKVVTAQKPS